MIAEGALKIEIMVKCLRDAAKGVDRVWALHEQEGMSLRGGALVGAIREVAAALEMRGIYP